MGRATTAFLRVFQACLAAAGLALTGFVINWFLKDTQRGAPGALVFLAFASGFSLVSVLGLGLLAAAAPSSRTWRWLPRQVGSPYVALAVESTNTVLYFAGFFACAIFLGRLTFCAGSVCLASRAESVVAAAAFCAWIASTVLTAKGIFVNRGLTAVATAAPDPKSATSAREV
ncbi:hypothetical protein JDV02_006443 [Purpureocillium takamizusanense]|uniref:MARVEL domain-containing protein n=1 Tax=Purpureocillium takamizusanense TaxID=2060973 RepID=A0A9Q8QKQ7_9HYPO|nr:uncharacterized protein JDV02_006443 [Purpureocillium takamizusanense]UNI20347.1 hypothetical protein JDV02_006443 [Purpureocillium takamizusanense]